MSDTALRGSGPTLLMAAHGTRTPAGVQTIHDLAAAVSVGVGPVQTAFVDVLGPHPAEILAAVAGQAVVVPTFLTSGFHVRSDLPSPIAERGHRDTVLTPTLGPDLQLADTMAVRLREVGWQTNDAVIMAAAGSSDPLARGERVPTGSVALTTGHCPDRVRRGHRPRRYGRPDEVRIEAHE